MSNNSFVDQLAFDGTRKHLLDDFTHIYYLDLHGKVRKNPKLSGTTQNVFGMQVGVGITVAVQKRNVPPASCPQDAGATDGISERAGRMPAVPNPGLHYHRVPESWRKEGKKRDSHLLVMLIPFIPHHLS